MSNTIQENNISMASSLLKIIRNTNVIYITVKNRDYIRVRQIERLLKENATFVTVYSSEKGNPLTRSLDLNRRIGNIDFSDADVVVVGFLPQLIWKRIKSKVKDKILVAEMFLSFYDTVVMDRKLVSKNGLIAKLCHNMDEKVVREANLVITDTRSDADYFAEEFCERRNKFEHLYLKTTEDKEFLEKIKEDISEIEEKSVLYFGTGLPLQGTDVVAKAFEKLSDTGEYKCIYIGGLKSMSSEGKRIIQNSKVEYFPWLSQQELYKKIAEAEICLAGHFNPTIEKADRTIPGKAFIYEALGKKMILGDTKANHEVFTEDGRHTFVQRGNVDELYQKVVDMVSMKSMK